MSIETGILIRAEIDGRWGPVDIGDDQLPVDQLVNWLRSKGGANPFAENLMLMFLGRPQTAHEVPFYIESADANYRTTKGSMRTWAEETGIYLQVIPPGDHMVTLHIPKKDARVYNGMMGLIRSIQVHNEEL